MNYLDKFWRKVNREGPIHPKLKTRCWLWLAGKFPSGYGSYYINGHDRGAHRVAWYLVYGKWPAQFCLHKCDNPSCVRPSHLFNGTPKDNMRDKIMKGRDTRGEKVCTAKLKIKDIRAIRAKYASRKYSQAQLAAMYKVVQPHISRIVRAASWRHV
jgi:hypothetical protein